MRQAPLAISIVLVFVLLCLIEIATVITSTINIIMLASYGTGWRWHESCATSTNIRAAEPTYYRRDWAGSFTKLCQLYATPANRLVMDEPRKEKSSFLNPSYAGLLSVGSQFRRYNFEGLNNAGSSFNDYNMMCYICYIISMLSCSIMIY